MLGSLLTIALVVFIALWAVLAVTLNEGNHAARRRARQRTADSDVPDEPTS